MAYDSDIDILDDLYDHYDKDTRHYLLNHVNSLLNYGDNPDRPYQSILDGEDVQVAHAIANRYDHDGAKFRDDMQKVDSKAKIFRTWSEGKDPGDVKKARLEKKSSGYYETSMKNGNYEDAAKWKNNAGKQFDPEADGRVQRYLQEEAANGI